MGNCVLVWIAEEPSETRIARRNPPTMKLKYTDGTRRSTRRQRTPADRAPERHAEAEAHLPAQIDQQNDRQQSLIDDEQQVFVAHGILQLMEANSGKRKTRDDEHAQHKSAGNGDDHQQHQVPPAPRHTQIFRQSGIECPHARKGVRTLRIVNPGRRRDFAGVHSQGQ